MKDRFSKAVEELTEKNAFICESCGSESVKLHEVKHAEEIERHAEGEGLHVRGLDVGLTRTEEIIVSDPSPFGA